ncbi:MAG: hypothetical protein OEQ74_08935 [Gammaproteobacteria bacterium]|nr:hypothetical protein [Gammaproteobacteria bacterium]
MLSGFRIIALFVFLPALGAQADVFERSIHAKQSATGLELATKSDSPTDTGKRSRPSPVPTVAAARSQSGFQPDFASQNSFFATLRKLNIMPLWQVVEKRDRKLLVGVDKDGTLGFHYSFRQR